MRRALKFILWTLAIIVTLLVLTVAVIWFTPQSVWRGMLGERGSGKLERKFSLDGPISIDWDWDNPYIHLTDIKLANTPGAKDPEMVSIDRLDFHIRFWHLFKGELNLPDISLDQPVIILEKHADGSANWDFPALSSANAATSAALPSKRTNFPILGTLTITGGKLVYRDQGKKIDLDLGIQTAQAGGGEQGAFTVTGMGHLQNRPFDVKAQGGSLSMLRDATQKYPLHLHVLMGKTLVDVDGTFVDPVKMEGVDTKLELRGDNLADLFYLTMIPLPPTPPYNLTGHLTKTGDVWTFADFKGKVGNSDLEGHLTDDVGGKRSVIKAQLLSRLLDMKDLAGFTGATPTPRGGTKESADRVEEAAKEKASDKLIPDVALDLSRLRASDLDVSLKAEKILAPGLPIENMDVRFLLNDGVLRLDPLKFGIAAGKVDGSLVLDGSKDVPHLDADLSMTQMKLKQFFDNTQFAPLTSGTIGGHFQLAGNGKSLADVLADSNGKIDFVMANGSISQLIVDAAGLDLGNGGARLLTGDKSTVVRCAVADFPVHDGILDSKIFVIDTGVSVITGTAKLNLKNETIDGKISASPKDPTITVHAPITLSGKIKHPSIGVDPTEVAARGAVAAGLSLIATPLAAIIPFISTGVGEDSDCKDLIAQAKARHD